MKKFAAVVGGLLGVLLIVVVAGALVLSCQLETIVEQGIEREGSKLVGTPVTVGSVDLSLLSGKGAITDLSVANPEGFDTPHVLDIGGASVHLDPWSALDSEAPVDIHSMDLSDATVTVEAYLLGLKTNVNAIKETISDSRAAHDTESDESGESNDDESASSKASQRKIRIERMRFKNTKVQVVFHGPRRVRKRSIGLTDFELTELGGAEGAPPREIGKQIFMEIATRAREAMFRMPGPWQKLRNKLLKNLDEEDLDRLKNAGSKLLDFGKALQEGASLRDLRDRWQEQRLGSADGGPSSDGGADAEPPLRDQLKAFRESLRRAREGRKRGKQFFRPGTEPVPPR